MAAQTAMSEPISKEAASIDYVESSSQNSDMGYDEAATKKLIRKIDWVLLPFLACLYLLSFLDRTNIGNARLAGLEEDLGMKGLQYNVSVCCLKGATNELIGCRLLWPSSFLSTLQQRFPPIL